MLTKRFFLLFFALAGGTPSLVGQVSPGSSPATVALVGALPAGGVGAVIQRRPGNPPADLILLDQSSSVEDLASAIAVLRASRKQLGDNVARSVTISIQRTETPRLKNPVARQRLQNQLAALRAASVQQVPGVGTVRSVVVPVGPEQGGGVH